MAILSGRGVRERSSDSKEAESVIAITVEEAPMIEPERSDAGGV
jgi:hypothetical protein